MIFLVGGLIYIILIGLFPFLLWGLYRNKSLRYSGTVYFFLALSTSGVLFLLEGLVGDYSGTSRDFIRTMDLHGFFFYEVEFVFVFVSLLAMILTNTLRKGFKSFLLLFFLPLLFCAGLALYFGPGVPEPARTQDDFSFVTEMWPHIWFIVLLFSFMWAITCFYRFCVVETGRAKREHEGEKDKSIYYV